MLSIHTLMVENFVYNHFTADISYSEGALFLFCPAHAFLSLILHSEASAKWFRFKVCKGKGFLTLIVIVNSEEGK